MLNIIFHEKYLNYSFGEGHPFWPERAKVFLEILKKNNFPYRLIEPKKVTDEEILMVHTSEYLSKLKKMIELGQGYLSLDTPVNKKNVEAAYYYVGGTIVACDLALQGKSVINTLGGLHHAESNNSSGFCIFNDHAIAIRKLQKERKIKKAAILDLDVHAGNGTQEIFYADPSVLEVSIHQDPTNFYPGTGFVWQKGEGKGKGFNINIPLPPGTGENEYLSAVDKALPKINDFLPDLLIVILGADTFTDDPLAQFELDKITYKKIAKKLVKFNKKAVLFAGGYSRMVPEIWLEFVKSLN